MGYTITEKILLSHTDKKSIRPGDFIYPKVDLCVGNDITAPLAIEEFTRSGIKRVFNKDKIALVPDHFAPAKDIKSAEQCKLLREFSKAQRLSHYYEVGVMGIEHALLPEDGLIKPGDLVVGADSHTCTYGAIGAFSTGVGSTDLAAVFITGKVWFKVPETIKFIYYGRLKRWVGGKDIILYTIGHIGVDGALYKAMEFTGETIRRFSIYDRFTMCNMAIEAGAKNGIIQPDDITIDYLRQIQTTRYRGCPEFKIQNYKSKLKNLRSDSDANYVDIKEYDVSGLEPQVALPHLPSNVRPMSKLGNVCIDQAVIGSCTNGWLSDLKLAAKVLKNKKVNSRVRLIVIPATQSIYLNAVKEGLVEIFIRAGGVVSTPTCGPCIGGHMGVLAAGERAIATTNRNFRGRMGHIESEVYLANPAVAAASAVKGRIAHPDEV